MAPFPDASTDMGIVKVLGYGATNFVMFVLNILNYPFMIIYSSSSCFLAKQKDPIPIWVSAILLHLESGSSFIVLLGGCLSRFNVQHTFTDRPNIWSLTARTRYELKTWDANCSQHCGSKPSVQSLAKNPTKLQNQMIGTIINNYKIIYIYIIQYIYITIYNIYVYIIKCMYIYISSIIQKSILPASNP